jgi:hypothetical protein
MAEEEQDRVVQVDIGFAGGRCPFRGIVYRLGESAEMFTLDERCPSTVPALMVLSFAGRANPDRPDSAVAGTVIGKAPVPVLREGTPCFECMSQRSREQEAGLGGANAHEVSGYKPKRRRASGKHKPRRMQFTHA